MSNHARLHEKLALNPDFIQDCTNLRLIYLKTRYGALKGISEGSVMEAVSPGTIARAYALVLRRKGDEEEEE